MSRLKVRRVAGSFASFSRIASAVDGGGGLMSHGGFTISSSMVVQLGLMLTLIVQYSKSVFFQKGTCSIIHGNSLFDMVVTTQPLQTCKKTTGERTDIPGCHGCLWYVRGMAKSVGVAEPWLQHFLRNGWFLNGKSNRINRGVLQQFLLHQAEDPMRPDRFS